MKFTRTSLVIVALAGLLSSSVRAQTNTPPGGGPGGRQGGGARGRNADQQLTQLSEQLKLTDAQKPRVKAVLEEQAKKIQELRNDTAAPQEDRRAKRQVIQQDLNKKLKEILTADQFKKFEEQQQQRGRRNAAGGAGGAAGQNRNRRPGGNAQQ